MNTEPAETRDAAPDVEAADTKGTRSGWYDLLFGPPFRLIGFFYRTYHSNRERLALLVSRPRVSSLIRYAFILTLLLWIAIWLFASDENRDRLTETVRQHFRTLETGLSD